MSIEIVDVDNIDYDFCSGLLGYYVYQKIWKPFIGQVITFAREEKNIYDRFAISGSSKIPGKIGRVVVGHIPRQLSRYMWYTLDSGAIISGKVISDKYKPSHLFQELEIPIKAFLSWSDEKSMTILKGYLRYKTITSQNVASGAQVKNFFLFHRKVMFPPRGTQVFVFLTAP